MKLLSAALATGAMAVGLGAAAAPANAASRCGCPTLHHAVHHAVRHSSVRREVVYDSTRIVVPERETVIYREAPPPPPVVYDEVAYEDGPVWYGGPRPMFMHRWHHGWRHGGHDFGHGRFHDWR
jgi:hypothetical protein